MRTSIGPPLEKGGSAKGVSSQMKATDRAVMEAMCARKIQDESHLFAIAAGTKKATAKLSHSVGNRPLPSAAGEPCGGANRPTMTAHPSGLTGDSLRPGNRLISRGETV
jgi:hypothetical protein